MIDAELRLLMQVSRRLPRVRRVGAIGELLRRFYARRPRPVVEADVLGLRMRLDPGECVDGALLLYPQLYDFRELAVLEAALAPGDTFLDLGANIGLYALVAARRVGATGRVLAVEADPENHARLCANLALNRAEHVTAVQVGVSDRREVLRLGINAQGNRGGNSFLWPRDVGVDVECLPLVDVLERHGVAKVDAAKLDLEGFEFRVLRHFFAHAPPSLWPRLLVVEHEPAWIPAAGGDTLALLRAQGYRVVLDHAPNYVLTQAPRR